MLICYNGGTTRPTIYAVEDAAYPELLRVAGFDLDQQTATAHRIADVLGIPRPGVVRAKGDASWTASDDGEGAEIGMALDAGPAVVAHEVAHVMAGWSDGRFSTEYGHP